MHNGGFDCWMVANNFGVELIDYLHTDTLALGHLLNENRLNGLKERGIELYGQDAAKEQAEMKASVQANGGVLTKDKYELYKADADLIAKYGAKDAILTIKLFYHDMGQLYDEGSELVEFFNSETMPLLRGPTYQLNTSGLRIDVDRLEQVRQELETACLEGKAFVYKEIFPKVQTKYPGTNAKNTFNLNAPQQLAWLVFECLGEEFSRLTDSGKALCHALGIKVPYAPVDKRRFISIIKQSYGRTYSPGKVNRNGKMGKPKKIGNPWQYMSCGKQTLEKLSAKYKWASEFLAYKKNEKLLNTYILGIKDRMKYGVIRPSFLQHGTTSGRYSSRNPNFQNLPKKDKRVKSCIISRPGRCFVGADESQLEVRVFASISQDAELMGCFGRRDDFYSVLGCSVYGITGVSLKKDDPNSFAKKYESLRDAAKSYWTRNPIRKDSCAAG
jgi:DNA polymerase I-like protein with 3'-5' exonuclease and polymerase domains